LFNISQAAALAALPKSQVDITMGLLTGEMLPFPDVRRNQPVDANMVEPRNFRLLIIIGRLLYNISEIP
jgi:hypothetical protein